MILIVQVAVLCARSTENRHLLLFRNSTQIVFRRLRVDKSGEM